MIGAKLRVPPLGLKCFSEESLSAAKVAARALDKAEVVLCFECRRFILAKNAVGRKNCCEQCLGTR